METKTNRRENFGQQKENKYIKNKLKQNTQGE